MRPFFAAAFVLALALPVASAAEKPNIVLIVADDLGSADLSCLGSDIRTPNIDSLVAGGVLCSQAYTTAPVCAPSRAGLLTGRYQQRFGFEDNPGPFRRSPDVEVGLDLNERTIADRLKRLGYVTGMVGKWHDGKEAKFQPPARGFDEFYGFNNGAQRYLDVDSSETPMMRGTKPEKHGPGYLTDTFGREAAAFVERHRAKPFFLYLSFNAPHGPLTAPEEAKQRYGSIADPKRRSYVAMVDVMDRAIGLVLQKLREQKLADNTLVIFLSDHGGVRGDDKQWASNGPLRNGKGTLYDGGLRTPLIFAWKSRLPAGATFEPPVTALDLLPTAVAAAGGSIDATWQLDGVDLLPYLAGKRTGRPHQTFYWRQNEMWGIRDGDWKIVNDRGGAQPQLFDLASDPGERTDLAAAHAERLQRLTGKFDRWSRTVEKPRFGWWPGVGPRVEQPDRKGATGKKHLFILSGQSNMAGLRPEESFTPTVASALGQENVLVVKDALGAQPIRRWHKAWKPLTGDAPEATGDLYDRLLTKVRGEIEGEKIATVTFVWMQGERDAKERHGEVYAASLKGLFAQLRADLGRKNVNVVIGRLSDFDVQNKKYPHWTVVREAQVAVAKAHPRGAWVDTDDLNDGVNRKGRAIKNDLHYSADGYKVLGKRFADAAIALIEGKRDAADGLAPEETDINAGDTSRVRESDLPYLETPLVETEPSDQRDGIPVGKLAEAGCDSDAIAALVAQIAEGKFEKIDSLLIAHRGQLVLESYFRRGRRDVPHYQMSITKSLTALALGRAMRLGHIEEIDKPVVEYLTEVDRAKLAPGAAEITVAQCLNMHSGIRIPEARGKRALRRGAELLGQGQAEMILGTTAPVTAKSKEYKYQGTDPSLVMQVVEAVAPGSAEQFIRREVLGKLGITDYRWQPDVSGLPKAAAGASLRSRDMLKLGLLVADGGRWNGEQLWSREFIEAAVSPLYTNQVGHTYGYFWWGSEMEVGGEAHRCISARGAGGQFIFVLPSLDLVVVVTSHNKQASTRYPFEFTSGQIVPAFAR